MLFGFSAIRKRMIAFVPVDFTDFRRFILILGAIVKLGSVVIFFFLDRLTRWERILA